MWFLSNFLVLIDSLKNWWKLDKNHNFYVGCNFWFRMAMETVDTAFESLDFVLFENKTLGTIGVPLSSIKTHLWPSFNQFHRLFWPIQRSVLGTNCTPMVPKVSLLKSIMFKLFSAVWPVSHACSRRRFFDLHNILKSENINYHAKISENLQILKNCTNRSRSHIHACNTGFELSP